MYILFVSVIFDSSIKQKHKSKMNILKAIKKLEKLTGEKIQSNDNGFHWVVWNGYTISFYPNGRMSPEAEATCYYTSNRERTYEDAMSDYFPGTFHDNITQAVNFVKRRIENR